MSKVKRVVLVGHCGADTWMLSSVLGRTLSGVPVVTANDPSSLQNAASGESLLLINRVLDGVFDTDSGLELIDRLSRRPDPPKMMLISNYADAQQRAVEAGALPGFGKAQAHDPATAARLREAVAEPRSQSVEPQINADKRR